MLFTPLKPMLLASNTTSPVSFDDPDLIYEPKFDGWRILLHKKGSRIEVFTRHGNCVTKQFPEFQQAAELIDAEEAILDAEGICYNPDTKRPHFESFNNRGRITSSMKIRAAQKSHPAALVPFDILYVDGKSLLNTPLINRKAIMQDILGANDVFSPTLFVEGDGQQLYDWTKEHGWEGIVAKRRSSTYTLNSRPPGIWVKCKNWNTAETVILGYQRNPFALLVGMETGSGRMRPVAVVEYGFQPEEKTAFLRVAQQIRTGEQKGTYLVEPVLRCKIRYQEQTENGNLRICTFEEFLTA